MPSFRHVLRLPLALALCLALLAGCGNDDSGAGASDDPEVIVPAQTQPATGGLPSMDGFLVAADESEVVVRTMEKEHAFAVAPEDVERLGIGHLASHAGLLDVGFRVFYEERDGERYIKGASEIPPPFGAG